MNIGTKVIHPHNPKLIGEVIAVKEICKVEFQHFDAEGKPTVKTPGEFLAAELKEAPKVEVKPKA